MCVLRFGLTEVVRFEWLKTYEPDIGVEIIEFLIIILVYAGQ